MRIYRASGLGGCIKAQAALQLGYESKEPPEKISGVFAEGNLHEEDVVARLLDQGFSIQSQQMEVNLTITPSVAVQGHIDGAVIHPHWGMWKLLEIKSMGKDQYDEWVKKRWDTPGLIRKYKWQVSSYMLSLQDPPAELMFVVKNRNNGQLDISYLEKPFYTKAEIAARVLEIERYVRAETLPECDSRMFPCPVYYLGCDVPESTVSLSEGEIEKLAEVVLEAKSDKDAAEAREKVARANLKAAVKGRMVIGDLVITPINTTTIRVERTKDAGSKGNDVKDS